MTPTLPILPTLLAMFTATSGSYLPFAVMLSLITGFGAGCWMAKSKRDAKGRFTSTHKNQD